MLGNAFPSKGSGYSEGGRSTLQGFWEHAWISGPQNQHRDLFLKFNTINCYKACIESSLRKGSEWLLLCSREAACGLLGIFEPCLI